MCERQRILRWETQHAYLEKFVTEQIIVVILLHHLITKLGYHLVVELVDYYLN